METLVFTESNNNSEVAVQEFLQELKLAMLERISCSCTYATDYEQQLIAFIKLECAEQNAVHF